MAILIDEHTKVVIQGITGKEGRKTSQQMLDYGTKVLCGVTPGKGGKVVNNIPVFDTVEEAKDFKPEINTSVIYVPPLDVLDAGIEAIKNGIDLLCIVTENVPIKDSAKLYEFSKRYNVRMVGPSSVGIINPGVVKLGSIGGYSNTAFSKGPIGVVSKSGGMTLETSLLLTKAGIGQSTALGIGGEVIAGSTFVDILHLFERDDETKAMVIFGEIGGRYEELVAQQVSGGLLKKPIIAYISGQFAESLPRSSMSLGHIGAIIEKGADSAEYKRKALRKAGVLVADFHDDILDLVRSVL